jgi:sugar-phosphatase
MKQPKNFLSIYHAVVLKINCRALLFDMDGVLIDSTPAVTRVWRRWAIERGFDPETVARMAQGRPSITTIRELLPKADHQAENREVERREMEDLTGVTSCPGAVDLLAHLPASLWALVTSSTKPLAEVRLRAAGLPIPELILTGNDVVHGKPHPEPFIKGAALVGFPPQQCIVVEDTPAGIKAGKSAGARVLAFRTTMPESELRAAGPDWIADNCSSLQIIDISPEHGISLLLQT